MKLWKKKVKEFGKDFEQSEEFEKNEEIGDAEEFEIEEPGKEPKVLEKLKGAGRKIGGFVKKHKLLTILLVLVLIAAIVAGVIWRGKGKKPQMQAMTIETARIEKMDLTNSVSVTGTLATANGKTASTTLKDIKVTKVYVEVGDEVQEGEVTYVAPTGTTGQTMGSNSGTASYEIQITLNEPQDKLRAGMTASVSIALEESRNALAVPYDCVQTNAGGDSVIYVDDNGEKKEVKVTTGIETDYYTEVISDELSEGMTVYLSTPLQQSTGQSGSDDAGSQDGVTFNFGGGGDMGGGPSGGSRRTGRQEHPAAVALRADSKEAAMTEEQNIIDLRQIVKRFYVGQPNELEILHSIDLQVKKGEFVSIVGASGSGKTTLMNIIGVLDRPTSGAYTLDGVDVAGAKDKELSGIRNRKIGFVFQTYNLISRTTALRNVELPMMYAGVGKKERQERAKYYLEMVGMSERMTHKPDELSGGQKQRVSIARAMTNDPSIILADEPTGALDSVTGRENHGYFP